MEKQELNGEDMLNYVNMIRGEEVVSEDLKNNPNWIVTLKGVSKQSGNRDIQEQTKAILRRWRACVKQSGRSSDEGNRPTLKLSAITARISSGASPTSALGEEAENNQEESHQTAPRAEEEEKKGGKEEEEEEEDDGTQTIAKSTFTASLKPPKDNVAFRCAQFLRESTSYQKAVRLGFEIEREICNLHSFPLHRKEYMNKARQMMLNLKDNEHIRRQVVNGTLEPHQLVRLSTEELANEEQNELRAKARANHVDAGMTDWRDVNSEKLQDLVGGNVEKEGLFQCYRCKSFHTTYTTAQTRSGDEAETIFIRCFDCGARKKTSG